MTASKKWWSLQIILATPCLGSVAWILKAVLKSHWLLPTSSLPVAKTAVPTSRPLSKSPHSFWHLTVCAMTMTVYKRNQFLFPL
uniref:Putative secreted protein n=1 Tax=Ixodes ricinus TaxID=34613 RepID=A0A6B0UEL7_IXORI